MTYKNLSEGLKWTIIIIMLAMLWWMYSNPNCPKQKEVDIMKVKDVRTIEIDSIQYIYMLMESGAVGLALKGEKN